MYVIFPADEVVYLSYGRLIVVPVNSNPETSNSPIRTNALPNLDRYSEPAENSSHSPNDSATIDCKLRENQPSSSRGEPQGSDERKPKRKSLRLNFNLLRRGSKKSETQSPLSLRVRRSVGHQDQAGITTPPSEAFKKFCNISGPGPQASSLSQNREKTPSEGQEASSQRSSYSSRNSKPSSLVQEDQSSKKSSKRSSSSSKSNKQEKLPNHIGVGTGGLQRSQSQTQRDTQKEPLRKGSTPTNLTTQSFYPLSTSREKNLIEPSPEPRLRARSNSFRLNFRRSKTPEVPARPDRKKDKKPKNTLERKLSFSDYLAEGRAGVSVSSDREKPPIAPEKSPVLSFFRKTPSPKNLGRDRTPYLSRDSGLYSKQFLQEPQFDDRFAGQKHPTGEGVHYASFPAAAASY